MVRVVINTFVFRIFNLISRKAIFLAIFMKNMADPSGLNHAKIINLFISHIKIYFNLKKFIYKVKLVK